MVLELAVSAEADVVTHNIRDFKGSEKFGVHVLTPRDFLIEMRKERK